MTKRYWFGAAVLLLVGILIWWVLPGTPHETQSGTNTNAADKELHQLVEVLKADYPDLYHRLSEDDKTTYVIPGLTQTATLLADGKAAGETDEAPDMTPQGMALVGDYLVISAYSKSYRYHSVLWLLDKQSGDFIKTVVLPTTSHVGGLAYDPDHERLWVTTTDDQSASQISAMELADLVADDFEKSGKPISFSHQFDLQGIDKSSYMTYHDQALYVGYFDKEELGHLGYFELTDQGLPPVEDAKERPSSQPSAVYDTPQQVQGLAILTDQVVFSQSYGNKDSKLLFFERPSEKPWSHFTPKQVTEEWTAPAYMQQILGQDQDLYLLFESSATQYRLNPQVESIDRVIKIRR